MGTRPTIQTPDGTAGRGWAFHVFGQPAPQGSKSAKGRAGSGRIILAESSKYVGPWRETITASAVGAGPCLDGPVAVAMIFTVRRPASARKVDRIPPRIPDLSKLARAAEDAITAAGLWADDARVAVYRPLAKAYPGCPYPGMPAEVILPVPGVVVAAVEMDPTGAADHRSLLARLVIDECRRAWARTDRWKAEATG